MHNASNSDEDNNGDGVDDDSGVADDDDCVDNVIRWGRRWPGTRRQVRKQRHPWKFPEANHAYGDAERSNADAADTVPVPAAASGPYPQLHAYIVFMPMSSNVGHCPYIW